LAHLWRPKRDAFAHALCSDAEEVVDPGVVRELAQASPILQVLRGAPLHKVPGREGLQKRPIWQLAHRADAHEPRERAQLKNLMGQGQRRWERGRQGQRRL